MTEMNERKEMILELNKTELIVLKDVLSGYGFGFALKMKLSKKQVRQLRDAMADEVGSGHVTSDECETLDDVDEKIGKALP
jgi:hypothetical protein